eukprot:764913-Hanusia_phi.AAC.2
MPGFCDGFDFVKLEVRILKEEEGKDDSEYFIEFIARLRASEKCCCDQEKAPENAPKGVKQTLRRVKLHGASDSSSADFRERSRFVKEGGNWFYAAGDVDFDPEVRHWGDGGAAREIEIKAEM